MAPPSPRTQLWRGRIETLLRVAAPALDAVLWVGDRVSRVVGSDDPAYVPSRRVRP